MPHPQALCWCSRHPCTVCSSSSFSLQFTFAEAFFKGFASRFPNRNPKLWVYECSNGRFNTELFVFCFFFLWHWK